MRVTPVLLGALLASLPVAARAHGDLHGQIVELDRQLARTPWRPQQAALLLRRGVLHRLHGQFDRAERDLSYAARIGEQTGTTLDEIELERGRLYLDWGKPEQATVHLERHLAGQANDPAALFELARALAKLGWGGRAVDHLDRAIALHPQPEPDHYLARSRVLVDLGPTQLRRALRGLDEGMRRLGPIVTLQTEAVHIEIRLGRWRAALARIDQLLAALPRKEEWLAWRAEVLARAGRAGEARAARRAAIASIDRLPPSAREQRATAELRRQLVLALASPAHDNQPPRRSR